MKREMPTLKEWLVEERFTLALSSSFFGFFAHAGLAAALQEEGIHPQKITGSSAGALVGAALASGLSSDALRELLFRVDKRDFWDPGLGAGLLKGKKFYSLLQNHLVAEFRSTIFPVEAAVFDLFSLKTKFITQGDLPLAVVASCAVPLMFHPVKIGGRHYIDGGVFHKSGMNLANPKERIFCAYFENPGLMGIYEGKTSFRGIGASQKVLRFKNLPQVNPNSLESGKFAYAEAYRRMKNSLQARVGDHFLLESKN